MKTKRTKDTTEFTPQAIKQLESIPAYEFYADFVQRTMQEIEQTLLECSSQTKPIISI